MVSLICNEENQLFHPPTMVEAGIEGLILPGYSWQFSSII